MRSEKQGKDRLKYQSLLVGISIECAQCPTELKACPIPKLCELPLKERVAVIMALKEEEARNTYLRTAQCLRFKRNDSVVLLA